MLLPHPSQYVQVPAPAPVPVPMQMNNDKSFGKKIKKAFYITILFIVFMNIFPILEQAQYIFTRRSNEFITENTNMPTLKGYFVSSFLLFCIVLWIITS